MLEQLIKEKAYAIWEAEGYPDGRAETHWEMAERALVATTDAARPVATTKKRVNKPRKKKSA